MTSSTEVFGDLATSSALVAMGLNLSDESRSYLMLYESNSSSSTGPAIDNIACISSSCTVALVADLFPRYIELSWKNQINDLNDDDGEKWTNGHRIPSVDGL